MAFYQGADPLPALLAQYLHEIDHLLAYVSLRQERAHTQHEEKDDDGLKVMIML